MILSVIGSSVFLNLIKKRKKLRIKGMFVCHFSVCISDYTLQEFLFNITFSSFSSQARQTGNAERKTLGEEILVNRLNIILKFCVSDLASTSDQKLQKKSLHLTVSRLQCNYKKVS